MNNSFLWIRNLCIAFTSRDKTFKSHRKSVIGIRYFFFQCLYFKWCSCNLHIVHYLSKDLIIAVDECIRCTHTNFGTSCCNGISTCTYCKFALVFCCDLYITASDLRAVSYSRSCFCSWNKNRYRSCNCCIGRSCYRTCKSLRTKISFIFAIHVLRKFRCNDHFIFAFYSNRSCLACCDDCLIVIYRNSYSHCKREFCPTQSHGCTTSKCAEIAIIVCQHFKHFAGCDISAYRSLCHMSGNVQSDCCRCLNGFFTRSIHVHGTSTLTGSVCLCLIICFFWSIPYLGTGTCIFCCNALRSQCICRKWQIIVGLSGSCSTLITAVAVCIQFAVDFAGCLVVCVVFFCFKSFVIPAHDLIGIFFCHFFCIFEFCQITGNICTDGCCQSLTVIFIVSIALKWCISGNNSCSFKKCLYIRISDVDRNCCTDCSLITCCESTGLSKRFTFWSCFQDKISKCFKDCIFFHIGLNINICQSDCYRCIYWNILCLCIIGFVTTDRICTGYRCGCAIMLCTCFYLYRFSGYFAWWANSGFYCYINYIECKWSTHTDGLSVSGLRRCCNGSCRYRFKCRFDWDIKIRHIECIHIVASVFKGYDLFDNFLSIWCIDKYKWAFLQLHSICRNYADKYFVFKFCFGEIFAFSVFGWCCHKKTSDCTVYVSGRIQRTDHDIVKLWRILFHCGITLCPGIASGKVFVCLSIVSYCCTASCRFALSCICIYNDITGCCNYICRITDVSFCCTVDHRDCHAACHTDIWCTCTRNRFCNKYIGRISFNFLHIYIQPGKESIKCGCCQYSAKLT